MLNTYEKLSWDNRVDIVQHKNAFKLPELPEKQHEKNIKSRLKCIVLDLYAPTLICPSSGNHIWWKRPLSIFHSTAGVLIALVT